MKIIAEIFRLQSGNCMPQLYCVDDGGEVIHAITDTMLDVVSELSLDELRKLKTLLDEVEAGSYLPNEPSLPDWSSNDKLVWFTPPRVEHGHVLISNENIPAYSIDGGEPQVFTLKQLSETLDHWQRFNEAMRFRGKENLIGEKFEVVI